VGVSPHLVDVLQGILAGAATLVAGIGIHRLNERARRAEKAISALSQEVGTMGAWRAAQHLKP
jgi:hypothetical protein